jgi:ketosteroid isomerase-like protein
MSQPAWIPDLFASIDGMDADRFVSFLTDDAVFRWGSNPAAEGKETVRNAVAGFFTTIKGLRHSLEGVWEHPDTVFVLGMVHYTRHDDSTVSIPFCNCLKMDGEKVREYLVYVDPTPMAA